jgi:hypothetical protein
LPDLLRIRLLGGFQVEYSFEPPGYSGLCGFIRDSIDLGDCEHAIADLLREIREGGREAPGLDPGG